MKKTPRSVIVMFDSVFFKFAIFYGTFSFQMKDSFEAQGKRYWEKKLTIH